MRRAYLVVGPEASGNRYLTRLLLSAGCGGGFRLGSQHEQVFDLPDGGLDLSGDLPERLAFCRSYPWGPSPGRWDFWTGILDNFRDHGYVTDVLLLVRDQRATELSQVKAGHTVNLDDSWHNLRRAYRQIVQDVARADVDLLPVPYSALGRHSYVHWLLSHLDLPCPDEWETFCDGDAKWL